MFRSNGEPMDFGGNSVILVLLAFIAMIVMFIENMLVTALPVIGHDYPEWQDWVPWVLAIYMLVGAVSTPIIGRLGDMYGKKRILIASMSIYTVSLFGCAVSWSFGSLLAFRAAQGIGIAMFPLAFGIISDTFPPRTVPIAVGIVSAMFYGGMSMGLIVGAFVVSISSWQICYYIIAPLFLLITVMCHLTVAESDRVVGERLDVAGAFLLSMAVVLLLVGLTEGGDWGWSSMRITMMLIGSLVLFASFGWVETRVRCPVVKPSLFRNRGAMGVNLTVLFLGVSMFMLYQTLPFFLQTPVSLGGFGITDTFTVGLYMAPSALTMVILGPYAGSLILRFGADRILTAGMFIFSMGFAMLALFHSDYWEVLLALATSGVGIGLAMVSIVNAVLLTSPKQDFGVALGVNFLFRVIGGSIGPVLAAALLAQYAITSWPSGEGGFVELWGEQGYVLAWGIGAAIALLGGLVAILMRPSEPDTDGDVPDPITR